MKRYLHLLMLLSLLFAIPVAQAQDTEEENPLLTFLAHVPGSSTQDQLVTLSYIDYRALEASRGIAVPTAENYRDNPVWFATSMGINSGFSLQFLALILDSSADIGFSFFDVDRSATFGQPPTQANLLDGDFNQQVMTAAYSTLGYEAAEILNTPAICSTDGCEAGINVDIASRFPGNPFGGHLGRREPIVFLPDLLANSPSLATVTQIIRAATGETPSLADDENYVALAEAASQHSLIQLSTLDGLQVMLMNPGFDVFLSSLSENLSPEEILERLSEETAQPGTLAPYAVAALVNAFDEDDELTQLMLVYNDEHSAQEAAETLQARLAIYTRNTGQTMSELIERVNGTVDAPQVYASESTGKFVAIWTLRNPIPSNAPNTEGRIGPSSIGFAQLINMIYMQDLGFLSVLPTTD